MSVSRKQVAEAHRGSLEGLVDYFDTIRVDTKAAGAQGMRFGKTIPALTTYLADAEDLVAVDHFHTDVQELAWPINEAAIFDGSDAGSRTVHAMRTVSMKQARGRIIGAHRKLVEWSIVSAPDARNRVTAARIYLAVDSNWNCTDVSNYRYENEAASRNHWSEYGTNVMKLLSGIQAQNYYEWHVEILTGSGMFLSVPTTPKMAQALLSQRDLPMGLTRRQAIRHLVSAHSRHLRSGETKVREHVRGRQRFTWDGLSGFVAPSQYDMDRLAR